MAKSYRRRDLEDDDDILRDGEVLHVPLYLMDGQPNPDLSPLQRDVGEHAVPNAARRARVTDGAGNAGLALHRPGYRIVDGIQRDMSVYAAYDAEAEAAYKNVGAGKREALGQRVDPQEDATSVTGDRSAAYREYESRMRNAWRNP